MGHTARSHCRRHPHPVAANIVPPAPAPPTTTADCTPPLSCGLRTPLASFGALFPPALRHRFHAPFSPDADHLSFFISTPRRHEVPSLASPPLLMDAEHVDEEEISTTAALLAEHEGADVSAMVQTHLSLLMAMPRRSRAKRVARRRRYCGSSVGRRAHKRRDFATGLQAIMQDYFGVGGAPPVYDERDFETRFPVPRAFFRRVYLAVKDEPFSKQRIIATGKLQAHPLKKVVAAFRVIAYGEVADRADEYVRLSRTVIAMSTRLLMAFIVERWGPTNLRQPNQEELDAIMDRNKERGMPGCIGSLGCCHWEWHQCPTGMAGAYQTRKDKRGIVIEAVCDEDLWIWHLFVGAPGSTSDINVIHQSSLYLDATGGRWPPRNRSYTINGRTRTLPYYLFDGIYPRFAFLISPHPKPSTEEQTTSNRL